MRVRESMCMIVGYMLCLITEVPWGTPKKANTIASVVISGTDGRAVEPAFVPLASCIKMKTSVMIADMTVCPILHGRYQARGARASELIL